MPVIIVKAREKVINTKEKKAALIRELSEAFARVAGDEKYRHRATVLIETISDDNWGRQGEQISQ
jgi:4-oxalocrotonate tautomerase family enzyme